MILEYACLRLQGKGLPYDRKLFLHDAPYNKRISDLRYALTQGIRILSRASKHTFHLLQDTTDASLVYYIGKWPSVAAYAQFRASEEREELIEFLQLCRADLRWQEFFEFRSSHNSHFRSALHRALKRGRSVYEAEIISVMRFDATQEVENSIRKLPSQEYLLTGQSILRVESGTLLPANLGHGDPESKSSRVLISGWEDEVGHDQCTRGRACLALDHINSTCTNVDLRLASPIRLW